MDSPLGEHQGLEVYHHPRGTRIWSEGDGVWFDSPHDSEPVKVSESGVMAPNEWLQPRYGGETWQRDTDPATGGMVAVEAADGPCRDEDQCRYTRTAVLDEQGIPTSFTFDVDGDIEHTVQRTSFNRS